MALPVLPVETFINYSTALGLNEGVMTENLRLGRLARRRGSITASRPNIGLADAITHEYAIPHENNLLIFVCRQPKRRLKEIWPDTKCFGC